MRGEDLLYKIALGFLFIVVLIWSAIFYTGRTLNNSIKQMQVPNYLENLQENNNAQTNMDGNT